MKAQVVRKAQRSENPVVSTFYTRRPKLKQDCKNANYATPGEAIEGLTTKMSHIDPTPLEDPRRREVGRYNRLELERPRCKTRRWLRGCGAERLAVRATDASVKVNHFIELATTGEPVTIIAANAATRTLPRSKRVRSTVVNPPLPTQILA